MGGHIDVILELENARLLEEANPGKFNFYHMYWESPMLLQQVFKYNPVIAQTLNAVLQQHIP